MEILNAIFLSDSYIKLFSLALCIIQCLSTFRLKLLSKILFIQFCGHFNLYAVSNMVFKTVQKLLTNFFKTFCYLEDSAFSFAEVLGKTENEQLFDSLVMILSINTMRRVPFS